MQFGLFYEAPEEPGQTHAERYAEMLDLIAFGEILGFDVDLPKEALAPEGGPQVGRSKAKGGAIRA